MSDIQFVWPSDMDRLENSELDRVCEYAEQLYDELEASRAQGAEPVARVVSGYSGDPDSRGSKQLEKIDLSAIPVGSLLYARPQGTDVPEELAQLLSIAVKGIFKLCGNSYANAWAEAMLRKAAKYGAYKGPFTGKIRDLDEEFERSMELGAVPGSSDYE